MRFITICNILIFILFTSCNEIENATYNIHSENYQIKLDGQFYELDGFTKEIKLNNKEIENQLIDKMLTRSIDIRLNSNNVIEFNESEITQINVSEERLITYSDNIYGGEIVGFFLTVFEGENFDGPQKVIYSVFNNEPFETYVSIFPNLNFTDINLKHVNSFILGPIRKSIENSEADGHRYMRIKFNSSNWSSRNSLVFVIQGPNQGVFFNKIRDTNWNAGTSWLNMLKSFSITVA